MFYHFYSSLKRIFIMPDERFSSSKSERIVPILLGVILAAMVLILLVTAAVLLGLWPQ